MRRLWGDGKGRFRTRGRHGAATVRGTKWLTEDRCDSTKITVQRGHASWCATSSKKKNKIVKKGQSYVAQGEEEGEVMRLIRTARLRLAPIGR